VKKWVVLSCTPNSQYDFFLPIAVRLWRKRIGYEPVIVLVGTEEDWNSGHAKVARDATQGRIEFFESIPGIPDSAVSMALRQHVSALEFASDDVILIGDVDLFPVSREFYHQHNPYTNPVGVYYADAYGDEYWPAYGVSMPVSIWREVMGITPGYFRSSVERVFTDENVRALGIADKIGTWDSRFWLFDEKYTSLKIKTSRFASNVATFPSTFEGRRPQRTKLPKNPYASDYVDFHCSRPGWTEENWPDIRYALAQIMPEDLRWLDSYVERYLESVSGGQPAALEAIPLPWDSDALKVRVGLLKADGPLPRALPIIEANKGKVDVVFVKADGWHDPQGVLAVDYTYEMDLLGVDHESGPPVVVCSSPRPAHLVIAEEAFRGTRFYRDPFLYGRAGPFFVKWIHGNGALYALEKDLDSAFLFVTVDQENVGRISLIAVAEKRRGTSVGGGLVCGVIGKLREFRSWKVRVNARNFRAIRFYENLGFRIKSVQTAFHVWPIGTK